MIPIYGELPELKDSDYNNMKDEQDKQKEHLHKMELEGWIFALILTLIAVILALTWGKNDTKEWVGEGEPPSEYEMRGGATWGN